MSALGQKQTFASQNAMSALPPKATTKADSRKRSYPLCPQKRTCAVQAPMSARGHKRACAPCIRSPIRGGALRLPGRSDLRCTHRLCHAEEDHDTLAAAARRQRLGSVFVAAVDVLPVVHHPDIARG